MRLDASRVAGDSPGMKPPLHHPARLHATGRLAALSLLTFQAVATIAPATSAWADEATERATGKAIKAQALFKSGQFIKAAEAFLEAYAVAPKATLLFNAARAYEEAKALDEAIALYERYLTLKDADGAGKADARKRLSDLTERRAAAAAAGSDSADRAPQPAHHIEPSPLPEAPSARKAAAAESGSARDPAAGADAKRGAQAAAADVDVEVSSPLWFLLGCAVIGLPLAYLSEPAPTPSRMLGRSEVWVASYSNTFRQLATERHRKMALYGCLSGLAITVISAAAR